MAADVGLDPRLTPLPYPGGALNQESTVRRQWMLLVTALLLLTASQTACTIDMTGVGEVLCGAVASGTRHFPKEQPKANECSTKR